MSVTTRDYSMLIGGAWAESESGARFAATSPATGETLGTLPEGTREDAQRAIAAANAARRRSSRAACRAAESGGRAGTPHAYPLTCFDRGP